ncbi:MAG: hypothetical protein DSZ11_01910 [Sulfurovum sp.]|nr:MAG: hypothetical protein DSZ11_01910 [Sulfurovum sp.]
MSFFKNKNQFMSLSFLLLATLMGYMLLLFLTKGNFAYAISAPYIHMSIAKYFIMDGMLSVDGETYSSATSAPLWMMLISPFYKLLGAKLFVYLSAVLNLLFQMFTILLLFKIVEKFTTQKLHYGYGILVILGTPFVTLTLGGAEHSLQIFLIIGFIYYFISYLQDRDNEAYQLKLLLLAPFIVFVRYEDIAFIVAVAMVVAFYLREWKFALSLLFSSLIFVLIFAFWSAIVLGIDPVPTSIIAKTTVNQLSFIEKFLANLRQPHIVVLLTLNFAIFIMAFKKNSQPLFVLSTVFIMTLIAHLLFARLGWMFRYEAYLITFGLLNIILYQHLFPLPKRWFLAILAFLLLGLSKQIAYSPIYASFSAKKIYEQKIQTANFVKEYYTASHLTTDNIGSIPYFSDVKVFDIHGLTNPEIISLKKKKIYTDKIKKALILKKNNEMIIAYSSRFKEEHIEGYTKIVEWRVTNRLHPSDSVVSFYSRDDKRKEYYLKLKNYSKELPQTVEVVWNISPKGDVL